MIKNWVDPHSVRPVRQKDAGNIAIKANEQANLSVLQRQSKEMLVQSIY